MCLAILSNLELTGGWPCQCLSHCKMKSCVLMLQVLALFGAIFFLQCQCFCFHSSRWSRPHNTKLALSLTSNCNRQQNSRVYAGDNTVELPGESLTTPTRDDMRHLAHLLANMTDHLDSAPEVALTIASQEIGWLFSIDVPKLTQMLLAELPELRQDKVMMRAYMFLLDFLEAISKETAKRLKANQKVMRSLLEAAKVSEPELNRFVSSNSEKLLSPDFTVYLDSEIEGAERNSPSENLLVTIKLRLLDEQGKKMGVDVTLLPKLAAEADPAELRRKTIMHLDMYDNVGKELFLQTLCIMMGELRKRYQKVDPLLLYNLQEVEKITRGCIEAGTKL